MPFLCNRGPPPTRRLGPTTLLLTGLAILCASGLSAQTAASSASLPNPVTGRPDTVVIKLATLAPRGSAWHEILKEMGARWREASHGLVSLRIYPSGVAGEEADVLHRIAEGELQAGSLSLAGLSRISTHVFVLAIPMAMESWEDLARVRTVMQPRLEDLFEEKGFVLLNWGDIGWVRFFLRGPDPSIEAVKHHRFVAWSDDSAIDLWKESGFQHAYLEFADILPALAEARVDAVGTTPLVMLANRWYPETPYMVEMPWTPLVGATLIARGAWQSIPSELRPELLEIAKEAGERMQSEIRRMESEAIAAMQERGLEVVHPSETVLSEWRSFFESAYPDIRGPVVPELWFDEVLHLTRGYR